MALSRGRSFADIEGAPESPGSQQEAPGSKWIHGPTAAADTINMVFAQTILSSGPAVQAEAPGDDAQAILGSSFSAEVRAVTPSPQRQKAASGAQGDGVGLDRLEAASEEAGAAPAGAAAAAVGREGRGSFVSQSLSVALSRAPIRSVVGR